MIRATCREVGRRIKSAVAKIMLAGEWSAELPALSQTVCPFLGLYPCLVFLRYEEGGRKEALRKDGGAS